jgi:signal peptidase I, bacterial type
MTDQDRTAGESAAARGAEHAATPEDDRRDVRSEPEGALPDEKQTTPAGDQAIESDTTAASPTSGTGISGAGESPASETAEDSDDPGDDSGDGGKSGKKAKKQGSFWFELPVLIGVALVLALIIKSFVVQAFYIPSQSMENTLKVGDRVLVNKIVYHTRDIHRGDVVVFNGLDSWDPEVDFKEPTNPVTKVLHAVGSAFGVFRARRTTSSGSSVCPATV